VLNIRNYARRIKPRQQYVIAIAFFTFALLAIGQVFAALSLSTTTAQTQNFDGIGTTATATLPTDFRADRLSVVRAVGAFTAAGTTTTGAGGANLSTSAANGIYNFGSGATTTGPDRAIGFLSSGTATFSGNLYAQLVNNTGDSLSGLLISYDVEKYRNGSNAAGFRFQLFYSTDGTNWTSAGGDFTTTFPADANNNGFATAPGTTVAVSDKTLSVTIPNGSDFYLAWNYSVASGSTTTNAQALAVDNISILGVTGPTNPTGVGAANPSTVATGGSTLLTVAVTPGTNPTSSGIIVRGDLSSIGGSATQPFFDDGTNGDIAAGDNTFSFQATVSNSATLGAKTLPITITDAQARTGATTISLNVQAPALIVISQVYGGGGNAGATFTNDFIELFNRGTAPVNITGWSVQYTSAAGTSWQVTPLSGTLAPGRYYLAQQAAGSGGATPLPTPDATGSIAMAAGSGKVALVSNTTTLSGGGCPFGASIVDFVGYGAASCSESGGAAPELSNTTAALRARNGCRDTNNNANDFSEAAPNPRNTASPINDCSIPAPFFAIHAIQGAGAASPLAGLEVTTSGIVTARKSNGFFLQTPDTGVDGDPNTSEGIFIFTSNAPAVAVGDAASAIGTVGEFFGLTQLASSNFDVTTTSSGNTLPAPVNLTPSILNPAGAPAQLERFEGMRMRADFLVSVAPTNEFGETFTALQGVARPLREPGIEISLPVPPDPTSGAPDCCIPRWDENPERIMIDSDGLAGSSAISVTSNVTFSNVTGPLDFTFGDYKVLPETPPGTTANMSAVPAPIPAAGEFTIAGFNIENFNNDPTQRRKAALAIRDALRLPDIIGTIEIFDLADLQALAAEIQSVSGVVYEARLIEADGTSEDADQDVGFLVKTSRIQIDSVTQVELAGCNGTAANCNTFIDPNTNQPALLNDRPPLVLRATVDPSGGDPRPIIVVVNHTRSFIDIELVTGEGPRVRAKRKAQAEFLANLLQDLQTGNPTTPVISMGDYNAYQFNDGYTDPVATIKGTPTADNQVVVDESPDVVNPNFINLTDGLPAAQRYSFIFEGTPQAIDHFIINTVANSYLQRYAIARNNSDFPEGPIFANDATRPERCSDHDMPVAYFKFPPRLTALGPGKVWIGLKNSDDVGARFDLLAEALKNGSVVGSGQLNDVPGGSSGFNNAILRTINLALSGPVDLFPGDTLSFRLSVRITAVGGHSSGTARLWYNGAAIDSGANRDAGSRVGATIGGTPAEHFLRSGFALNSAAGSSRVSIDVFVNRNAGGNPFKPFGTWSKTF